MITSMRIGKSPERGTKDDGKIKKGSYVSRGNSAARSISGRKGATISQTGRPIYSVNKGPVKMLKSYNSQARLVVRKENMAIQNNRMEYVQKARAKMRAKMKAKLKQRGVSYKSLCSKVSSSFHFEMHKVMQKYLSVVLF